MKQPHTPKRKPAQNQAQKQTQTRHILTGADNALPTQHIWHEGSGYSIYAAEQPRSSWHEHSHDCVQVTIGLEPAHVQATWSGNARPGGQRELTGNIVSIIPAGEPHSTLWQRRATLIHLYLTNDLLAETASRLHHPKPVKLRPIYLARDLFLEELGRTLFRECHGQHPCSLIADATVTLLTAHLLRTYTTDAAPTDAPPTGGLGPTRERRIREHIEQFLDQDLSIHALARIVAMNPQYFAHAFRLTTGFTPHRYVSHRRISRAQQLLTETTLSLSDIAYQCGFKSQGQFTTLFRQLTGTTPGKFRST